MLLFAVVAEIRLRTRRPGVRISQGAPLLLESDSCSEMNIFCFRPFPTIPSNFRLSENFFDGITKPRPVRVSGYPTQSGSNEQSGSSFTLTEHSLQTIVPAVQVQLAQRERSF